MKSFLKGFSEKLLKQAAPSYHSNSVFPVLTIDQLIPEVERKGYLKRVQDLVALPKEHFDALYVPLVTNFVEFVQVLPMTYGESLTSLLQAGLRHGLMAVQLLFDTETRRPDPLYVYAVFSMALLMDSIQVMATQKVMMCDKKGSYHDEWCPFNGSMVGKGDYYKVREYGGHTEAFVNNANPMLAQLLVPDIGMQWLASDSKIIDMWIACLMGHEDWADILGSLLKLLKKLIADMSDVKGMVNIGVHPFEPEDTDLAEKFLKWLKDGLEDGSISVNKKDSDVHIMEDGIFIETEGLFDAFDKSYSHNVDFRVLQKGFNYLGITKRSGYDFKFDQYRAEAPDTRSRRFGLMSHDKEQATKAVQQGKTDTKHTFTKHDSKTKVGREGLMIKDKGLIYKNAAKVPPNSQVVKSANLSWVPASMLPNVQPQRSVHAEAAAPAA